jgi:amino acid transporter
MSDSPSRPVGRTVQIAAVIDMVAILVFVMLGRKSHHEDGSFVAATLKVAGPFLIALVAGWIVARAWKAPTAFNTGIQIWLVTIVGGMLLRHFAFSKGTATAFIIVASTFTLVFLVGWRMLWEWRAARR